MGPNGPNGLERVKMKGGFNKIIASLNGSWIDERNLRL